MTGRAERGVDRVVHAFRAPRRARTFQHLSAEPKPRFLDVARIMWRARKRPRRRNDVPVPTATTAAEAPATDQDAITWVGHATFLLRLGGASVLVDPVWSHQIPGAVRRTPPGIDFDALPELDAVLVTHNHYDHLDAPTFKALSRSVPVLAPAGLGRWFDRRGFTTVTELSWWESARLSPDVRARFVPARHWSRRGLRDTCRSLWGGWVFETRNGRSIYHAGDTGYGSHFARIGSLHGPFDLALLPIGAYAPRPLMHRSHMAPEEAVRAAEVLGARRVMGMHWGTFSLGTEPLGEPVERMRNCWHARGLDAERLWELNAGETRSLLAPGAVQCS
ncbi:MBL fold metallo-hydrolase [Bounagaea algeriensis]